jgi:hypothetical protein
MSRGGPVSPTGKARAFRTATKHGAWRSARASAVEIALAAPAETARPAPGEEVR